MHTKMYLVDSTQTTYLQTNSYVTNAYQISKIRWILLMYHSRLRLRNNDKKQKVLFINCEINNY